MSSLYRNFSWEQLQKDTAYKIFAYIQKCSKKGYALAERIIENELERIIENEMIKNSDYMSTNGLYIRCRYFDDCILCIFHRKYQPFPWQYLITPSGVDVIECNPIFKVSRLTLVYETETEIDKELDNIIKEI